MELSNWVSYPLSLYYSVCLIGLKQGADLNTNHRLLNIPV